MAKIRAFEVLIAWTFLCGASFAQLNREPPQVTVNKFVAKIPRGIGLSSSQKKQVSIVFLDLLVKERKLAATSQNTFIKRTQVADLERGEEAKLQKFLSKRQLVMLMAWRENLRHQSRR